MIAILISGGYLRLNGWTKTGLLLEATFYTISLISLALK